jgi:hypothetical protein
VMRALSWSGPDHEHPRHRRCRLNRSQTSDSVVRLLRSHYPQRAELHQYTRVGGPCT